MDKITEAKKQSTLIGLKDKIQDLLLLPAVVARLMSLSSHDEKFFEKVLELANDDPPFAVRLIQLANSAVHAPIKPITTLPHAISRIGAQQIISLIFSMAVLRVFVPTTQGQRNLWIHAIQVGLTSRAIAKLSPSLKVDPEQAYLCGILHDIGRFVQFEESVEELGKIDESHWTTPQQLIKAEMKLYGFDHAELGWHACQNGACLKLLSCVLSNTIIILYMHPTRNTIMTPLLNIYYC